MDLTSDNVNVYQKFLSDYYHHNDNLKMAPLDVLYIIGYGVQSKPS